MGVIGTNQVAFSLTHGPVPLCFLSCILSHTHRPPEKKKSGPGRKSNAEHAVNFYNYCLELNKEGQEEDEEEHEDDDEQDEIDDGHDDDNNVDGCMIDTVETTTYDDGSRRRRRQ